MSDDILQTMLEAADVIEARDDNLLKVIAMLAANGDIIVAPRSSLFGMEQKPILTMTDRMYDRLIKLYGKKEPAG